MIILRHKITFNQNKMSQYFREIFFYKITIVYTVIIRVKRNLTIEIIICSEW